MCTHENKFIALSRLSNVAMASANEVSDAVIAKMQSLTYDMIVILLYTELNPCPRIGMLYHHRNPSVRVFKGLVSRIGSLTPSPKFARSTSPSCNCFRSLCAC